METNTKRPDSIEAALKVTGDSTPDYSHLSEDEAKHQKAQFNWQQIVKSLNKTRDPKWKADYYDSSQIKHWPYAWLKKDETKRTGFGLSGTDFNCTDTVTDVGVRLLFASSDDVLYALKTFEQEYIESIIY